MFGTIRKHQTWLWAVIISLTIISFVIFFSPYSKMNAGGGRRGGRGSINGEKVTDQMYAEAYREAELQTFFNTGRWLSEDKKRSDQDIDRDIYQWLLLVQKQNQYAVHVDEEAAAEMGRRMMKSFERAGVTSPQVFIQKVLQPHGLTVGDFERYIKHFMGIQELINTVGVGGTLVTPQEAKALYEREHQEVATEAVLFSASNYVANVQVTPEAIAQFYSNRVANYVIPERVSVAYVRFNVTNFLAQAETDLGTNISDIVEANIQRLGTNLATVLPEAKSPAEARQKVREQIIRQQAMIEARRKASEFATAVYELKPQVPQNLGALAASNGLAVSQSAPFDRISGPKELEVGPDFTKAAFNLSAQDPFSAAIAGQDGFYVFALDKHLPSETPPLDQVRERVTADYKRSQALAMARQAGGGFYQVLTNGLAQSKAFTNLCLEGNFKPIEIPPFSLSTRSLKDVEDFVGLNQLKQVAFATNPNEISQAFPVSEGSMILYVKNRLPVDQAKMQADMPAFVNTVRRSRQSEAFDEWFRREAEKGLRDTPIGRPQPSSLNSGAKS